MENVQQERPAAGDRRGERVRTMEVVFPNQTNHYGTMFGGEVLALADKAAYFAASRYCRGGCVTASTERFDFRTPIRSGDTIEIEARVALTGRTSMIVRIDIYRLNLKDDNRVLCTSGHITMVAVDPDGRTQPVPQLLVETDDELAEWEEARKIRKQHERK